MAENTKIEIQGLNSTLIKELSEQDYLIVCLIDREVKKKNYGSLIRQESENSILLKTQLFESRILLNLFKKEEKVAILSSEGKELCEGKILALSYCPATKDSFERKKYINKKIFRTLKVNKSFSNQEKMLLELGLNALTMDDKWFSYMENDTIHYFRSWNGREIYRGCFYTMGNNEWCLESIKIPYLSLITFFPKKLKKSFFLNLLSDQIELMKDKVNKMGITDINVLLSSENIAVTPLSP